MLAREDIDEAVYAILFRENYIVKVSGCMLRSGGARADVMLCRREGGKAYERARMCGGAHSGASVHGDVPPSLGGAAPAEHSGRH